MDENEKRITPEDGAAAPSEAVTTTPAQTPTPTNTTESGPAEPAAAAKAPETTTVKPEEVGTGRIGPNPPPINSNRPAGGAAGNPPPGYNRNYYPGNQQYNQQYHQQYQQNQQNQSYQAQGGGGYPPNYGAPGGYGSRPGAGGAPTQPGLGAKPAKKKTYITIGLVAALLLLMIIGISSCTSSVIDDYAYAVNEPYIANLYVSGSISTGNYNSFGQAVGYQHYWTLDQIDYLMYDNNNKAIVLVVDSPGGGVYESDELYLRLKEYQEYTGRPVYAVMESYAASGGYYISAAADRIYANRNTWTGSIGVTMGTFLDISEFLAEWGIKTETITSGANKAMGSSYEPMTEEQRAIFQSLIDEAYDQFVGIVAEERELTLADTVALADGRIYTAKQALELELIDAIGDYADAVSHLRSNHGLRNAKIVDVVYESKSTFLLNLLSTLDVNQAAAEGDLAAILKLVEAQSQRPISYMCDVLGWE